MGTFGITEACFWYPPAYATKALSAFIFYNLHFVFYILNVRRNRSLSYFVFEIRNPFFIYKNLNLPFICFIHYFTCHSLPFIASTTESQNANARVLLTSSLPLNIFIFASFVFSVCLQIKILFYFCPSGILTHSKVQLVP